MQQVNDPKHNRKFTSECLKNERIKVSERPRQSIKRTVCELKQKFHQRLKKLHRKTVVQRTAAKWRAASRNMIFITEQKFDVLWFIVKHKKKHQLNKNSRCPVAYCLLPYAHIQCIHLQR